MRRLMSGLLLLGALVVGLRGIRHDAPTVDEFAHLPAGAALWRYGSFGFYGENPPLAKLLMAAPVVAAHAEVPPLPENLASEWAPWIYGQRFEEANRERYLDLVRKGRLAILGVTLLGGLVLFLFARSLFGESAALGALALYLFCPNLMAHGRLATTDAVEAVALLGALFALRVAVRRPGAWRAVLVGLFFALALLSKFTALVALPIFAGVLLLAPRAASPGRRTFRTLLFLAVVVLGVNAGYAFHETLARRDALRLESAPGRLFAAALPAGFRVPLPKAFVEGVDSETRRVSRGEFGTYLRGELRKDRVPEYDVTALLVKLTLPAILLVLAGLLVTLVVTRARLAFADEAIVWLFPLLLLAVSALGSRLHVGVRLVLPIFPLLFLGASRLFALPRVRILAFALAAAHVAIGLRAAPHELAYFNEIAGGTSRGHEWLLDSNLDWGQDLSEVPEFVRRRGLSTIHLLYFGHAEPGLYGVDYRLPGSSPAPGTYVVSANFAKGVSYVAPDHGRMISVPEGAPAWLKARKPDGRIGASLWVYEVP